MSTVSNLPETPQSLRIKILIITIVIIIIIITITSVTRLKTQSLQVTGLISVGNYTDVQA